MLAIAVIVLEIIVFGAVIARMRYELDRERGFVETLQSAASVRLVAPQHLALGTAYRSATRGARIGGDVYNVYRLHADRTHCGPWRANRLHPPQDRFLPIERAAEWIAQAPARTPQQLVDALVDAVRRYTRGRITDDLAILAVEPLP